MASQKSPKEDETGRLYAAGLQLLLGLDGVQEPEQAVKILMDAVEAGSGKAAARLAVLTAAGVAREQSWTGALDLLQAAAILGDRPAQRQLGLLTADTAIKGRIRTSTSHGEAVWRRARAAIDLRYWLTSPSPKIVSATPQVATLQGFAPPEVCRWLIKRAEPGLAPAQVNDPATGRLRSDPMRSNAVTRLGLGETDLIMLLMQARISAATGFVFAQMEVPNLLRYEPGQEYRAHYDFFNPVSAEFQEEIATFGQRVSTFLVYLNEEFDGGETEFPQAALRYRGRTGDALLFQNVRRDGSPDPSTLHAGLPPTRGQKWLMSQWIRDRAQPVS